MRVLQKPEYKQQTEMIRKRMKGTITLVDEFYCKICKNLFSISVNHLNYCPECGAKVTKVE